MPRYLFVVNRVSAQKPTYSTAYLMAALVRQGCDVWATDLEHLTWNSTARTVARAWRLPTWARQPFAVCQALASAAEAAAAERLAWRQRGRELLLPPLAELQAVVPAEIEAVFEPPPVGLAVAPVPLDPPLVLAAPVVIGPAQAPLAGVNVVPADASTVTQVGGEHWQALSIDQVDATWLRCNFHATTAAGNPFLAWAHGFEAAGKVCFNAPGGLWRTADKSHLFDLPAELRPRSLLSSNRADLLACIRFLGRTVVLKPAGGFGGEQVYIIERGRFDNLNAILDSLLEHGPVLVQEYLQAAADGDRRVLLWEGRPMEIDGHTTLYRRMRPPGDLRNNLHIGGIRARCRFNRNDAAVIDGVAAFVKKHGIWLAGVDIIGGKVLEINACAPGGIHNINELYGIATDDWIARAATEAVHARQPQGRLQGAG